MTGNTQPVGPVVDATPAQRPGPITLQGRFGRVERLAQHHDAALWDAVKGHDPLWTYMGYGPFADFAAFSAWIGSRLPLDDPYSYAVVEPSDSLRENTRRSYRSFMHCENDRIPPPPLRQSQALAARGGNLTNRWRVTNGA